jgi:hypothetical protein
MRLTSLAVVLSLCLTMMGLAATATKRKAPAKKTPVKSSSTKKASTTKKASGTKSASAKARSSRTRRAQTTWRNRQLSPTPDRYKEIQQALHDKGYLKSEPNGVWDDDSQNAMERFQTDQKLPSNGKITAASLIGLGLGARSAGAPEAPALPGAPGTQPAPAPASAQPAAQTAAP